MRLTCATLLIGGWMGAHAAAQDHGAAKAQPSAKGAAHTTADAHGQTRESHAPPKSPGAAVQDAHATAAKDAHAPAAKDAHGPAPKDGHDGAPKDGHGPADKRPAAAAADRRVASGGHAAEGAQAAPGASRAVQKTVHPEDDVDRAAAKGGAAGDRPKEKPMAATTVGDRQLDAVMERITKRISGGAPTAARANDAGASAKQPAAPVPPVRRPIAGRAAPAFKATAEPPAPRVRLNWRPTVVWPRAVLPGGNPDGQVRLEWDPAVD